MSGTEMIDEYYMDLPDIQDQTIRFDKSEYVSRYLWKHHKQPEVVITKIFTTPRKNSYIGVLVYMRTGVGRQKKWNWSSFHIGLMDTSKGECAIAFYTGSRQALKFTPHFFKRYKERFIKICDWRARSQLSVTKSITDIITVYIKRNLAMTWIETKSVFSDKVHIFGPVNDGVALLQWDKSRKLLQANTFITNDMLDEKQAEMVRYARIYLSLPKEQRKKFKFPDFIYDNSSNTD